MDENPKQMPSRILVVDDESMLREMLSEVLRRESGYEVFVAGDGLEAQEFLKSHAVDLVITDLLMPGMGGLALLQWGQEHSPQTAWIILTGRGTFDDAVRAVQLGAFDFITKPLVSLKPFIISVRNALRHKRLSREREELHENIEDQNRRLTQQVNQLKEACRMLCQQAETMESDLRRAELIQRALLPFDVPHIPGLSVHSLYRPSLKVGGDLYDVTYADKNSVVAYVADAAGHGISAAMLAVLFKHRLAMTDDDFRPNEPRAVLDGVNKSIMNECSAPGLFVTAAYCLLDRKKREITVASAGHPPLVLCRAGRDPELIFHTGPALGLVDTARYGQKTFPFREGDRLLLYTDGLLDTPLAGPAFSLDDLIGKVSSTGLRSRDFLDEFCRESETRWNKGRPEDDLTLLLLSEVLEDSFLDNGVPAPAPTPVTVVHDPKAEVLIGREADRTWLSVSGRATWIFCTAFQETCLAELAAGRELVLDLARCTYLDSTFLGTIQHVVHQAEGRSARLRIQGLVPATRALFEELGMERVLGCVTQDSLPMPGRMDHLKVLNEVNVRTLRQMLEAHQALASLNEENRQEFLHFIETLQNEMA